MTTQERIDFLDKGSQALNRFFELRNKVIRGKIQDEYDTLCNDLRTVMQSNLTILGEAVKKETHTGGTIG